jgi:hypothetical protein
MQIRIRASKIKILVIKHFELLDSKIVFDAVKGIRYEPNFFAVPLSR